MSKDMTVAEVLRLRTECEKRVQEVLLQFSERVMPVGVQVKDVRVNPYAVQTIGGENHVLPYVRIELELRP